jgi:alpha/beta superfamily hydrolase
VAMTAGALDDRVTRLVGLALPSTIFDFSTVRDSPKPKFFIHGEHDEVCPLGSVRELYARAAEPKDLVVIHGADHLFDGRLAEVAETIEDLLG